MLKKLGVVKVGNKYYQRVQATSIRDHDDAKILKADKVDCYDDTIYEIEIGVWHKYRLDKKFENIFLGAARNSAES